LVLFSVEFVHFKHLNQFDTILHLHLFDLCLIYRSFMCQWEWFQIVSTER